MRSSGGGGGGVSPAQMLHPLIFGDNRARAVGLEIYNTIKLT